MGYYILQSSTTSPCNPTPADVADLDRWRRALESASRQERQAALRQLVAARAEETLAQALASANPAVVQLAVAGLWECWLGEAGEEARREIEEGTEAMNSGDLESAAKVFSGLTTRHPTWAEPINKLATVRYLQNRPEESIALCRKALTLKPDHFGAWNGLALCAIQTEDWPLALQAVRESLRLQPSSPTNRQLLSLVQSRLPEA